MAKPLRLDVLGGIDVSPETNLVQQRRLQFLPPVAKRVRLSASSALAMVAQAPATDRSDGGSTLVTGRPAPASAVRASSNSASMDASRSARKVRVAKTARGCPGVRSTARRGTDRKSPAA